MTEPTDTDKRPNPYAIAIVILAIMAGAAFVFWIATRPNDMIEPIDKGLIIALIIGLAGKPIFDRFADRYQLSEKVQSRITYAGFCGLLIGFLRIDETVGTLATIATFCTAFVLAVIGFFIVDITFGYLKDAWKSRMPPPAS